MSGEEEQGAEGVPLQSQTLSLQAGSGAAEISTASVVIDTTAAADSTKEDQQKVTAEGGSMVRHSNGSSRAGSKKSERSTQSYQPLRSLGDVSTVRDLNRESVRDILRHATSDHSLEIVEMGDLEDMSGLNDAFNSTICSLKCKASYKPKGKSEPIEEEFNFVVKSPPKSSVIRFAHKFTLPFCNEVSWYSDLVRQLELANGAGCLKGTLPTCFHASSTYYTMETEGVLPNACDRFCSGCWLCFMPCRPSENGVLILENVKKRPGKAYHMFNKNSPVPIGHVELVMAQLARFHGMWLKYRMLNKSGRLTGQDNHAADAVMPFDTFLRRFRAQAKVPKVMYKQLKNVAKKTILQVLDKFGPEGEKAGLITRCKTFFDVKANRTLNTYFVAPPSPEVHTLCHGDFWSNNILFSYKDGEEGQGVPDDLIIIDYQLINYGHPCYDLVYFLYLNTDLAFRDAHLEDILNKYYADFSAYFDTELEPGLKTYSLQKFKEDFHWHKQIGFTTACSVMPNVLSDQELNLEGNMFTAFRELQRKQQTVLEDKDNPTSIEIRRRLLELVTEMARDEVL